LLQANRFRFGYVVEERIGSRANLRGNAVMVLQLDPVAKKVADLLEPHIESQGFELIAVEHKKGTRHSLLRLLVDKPDGGISLNDLEKLSPTIGDLLDVYDPIEGRYMFEMASPGVNRPLTRRKDFESHVGRRVRLRLFHPRDGRRNFEGVLAGVNDDRITLDDYAGSRHDFPFGEIQNANYEHKFD
jgi:ribosome maturation factor RimP